VLPPASGHLHAEAPSCALLHVRPGAADFDRLSALAGRLSELAPDPEQASHGGGGGGGGVLLAQLARRAAAGSTMDLPATSELYVWPAAEGSAGWGAGAGDWRGTGQDGGAGGAAGRGGSGSSSSGSWPVAAPPAAAAAVGPALGGKSLRRLAARLAELLLPGRPAAVQPALLQHLLPRVLLWCDRLPNLAHHPATHLIAMASAFTCPNLVSGAAAAAAAAAVAAAAEAAEAAP
jgi:hypothetical protein